MIKSPVFESVFIKYYKTPEFLFTGKAICDILVLYENGSRVTDDSGDGKRCRLDTE